MADRSPRCDASTSGSGGYIEHTVSKLDTLAGVAIKYGVEVADVKRLNGLTTDLQMFAFKTLRIPTSGRHPPSIATADLHHSRWETSTTYSGLRRVSSQDSISHSAGEKAQRSAAMDLLRGYYGLPASRTEGEGTELATFSFDNDSADEPFSPMFRPSDTTNSRRLSTGDYRTSRFEQSRETRNNSDPSLATTDLLMKPSRDPLRIGEKFGEIEVVTEAEPLIKERPVRRRGRGDSALFGSFGDDIIDVNERVNFLEKVSVPRAKDSTSSLLYNRQGTPSATNGWHNAGEGSLGSSGVKNISAALFGGKGAVEGLISKVLQSTVQDGGKSSAGAVPTSTGTPSVLEGITQVYRRAKAALD